MDDATPASMALDRILEKEIKRAINRGRCFRLRPEGVKRVSMAAVRCRPLLVQIRGSETARARLALADRARDHGVTRPKAGYGGPDAFGTMAGTSHI